MQSTDLSGLGYLHFIPTNWSKVSERGVESYGPLRGCSKSCAEKHSHHECILHELEPPLDQQERACIVHHSKLMLREAKSGPNSCGLGWIYAGSHNLSGSAWGMARKIKTGRAITMNNFELGVLLLDVDVSAFDLPFNRIARRYDPDQDTPYGFVRDLL